MPFMKRNLTGMHVEAGTARIMKHDGWEPRRVMPSDEHNRPAYPHWPRPPDRVGPRPRPHVLPGRARVRGDESLRPGCRVSLGGRLPSPNRTEHVGGPWGAVA